MTSIDATTRRGVWEGAHGNRIAWEAFDAESTLSIVFAHGGGQTGRAWRLAARRVQAAGFAALTFDKRGHGASDWIENGDYRLESFSQDLNHVVRAWGRPCVIVGASLGGLSALITAAAGLPEVRGIVAIDTAPELNATEIYRLIEFLSGAEEGFPSVEAAVGHLQQYFPARVVSVASMQANLTRMPNGFWRLPWDVRVVTGELNSVALPHEKMLYDCARRVAVPYLLVRAGDSNLVSDGAVQRLRACVSHLEVVTLPDADHLIGGEDGVRVMDMIRPFLDRISVGIACALEIG
ncbi:MAG: alpha/beta hydrolase [Pseudomonadota bacterium]